MSDGYADKFVRAIKECKTDDELRTIINKIYEDGFTDGVEEGAEV
jgi:hypothetical protein